MNQAREDKNHHVPSRRERAPLQMIVNCPAAVFIFAVFMTGQTALLLSLVREQASVDLGHALLLWAGVLIQGILVMLLVMLLLGFVAHRRLRAFLWVLSMVASTIFLWDYVAYSLVREHLWSASPELAANVLSDHSIMQSRLGPLWGILSGYFLTLVCGTFLLPKLESKWPTLARKCFCRRLAAAAAIALLLGAASQVFLDSILPRKTIRASASSLFAIPRLFTGPPRAEDPLFRVASPRFRPVPQPPAGQPLVNTSGAADGGRKPDIFLFVIDSVRRDCLCPEIMPNLDGFSKKCLRLGKTVANANQTHMSFTAIMHGRSPFYYHDTFRSGQDTPGAMPLRVLRELGYRTKAYVSPDLYYFDFARATFGTNNCLIDELLEPDRLGKPGLSDPAATDEFLINRLSQEVSRPRGDTPCFYLVMLDSVHLDYSWGKTFQPPFQPYTERVPVVPIAFNPSNIERLHNRYRNAAAYADQLMGRFLSALEQQGRLGSSIVVVTGDHGEEFLERQHIAHGSELNHFQMEVPILFHLPDSSRVDAARIPRIASHVDIFPTIFDFLRVDGGFSRGLSGHSLLGTNAPLCALAVQHRGSVPVGFVIDLADQKLWVDLVGAKRTESGLEVNELAATTLSNAMDEDFAAPARAGRGTAAAIPAEARQALGKLIFLE